MADNIDIRLRLRDARRFSADTKRGAKDIRGIGDAADRTRREARGASTALRGIAAAGRRGFGGLGRLIAFAGGTYYLGRGIRFVAEEYTEAARAGAQTDAVIKSTGGAAGVTRRRVEGLSAALSRQAAIDDELIQQGANVLLTFKRIRNEAGAGNKMFDRATAGALDLSVAFNKDLRSSAVLVGKALDDPIRGVTALRRVGVQLTEQQEEQITKLHESGDTLGAQKLIMKELESQVKGSAKAQAQPMDRLKIGWANMAESIGRLAAPTVLKGINQAADLISQLDKSLTPIWERGDLGFEEKMERSMPKVERAFEKAEIGKGLSKAVESGMPIVADAMARSAPKAARAFITGFQNAGPWGKLLTLGFLAHRMGAFRGAGGFAAGRFMDRFGPTMKRQSKAVMTTAATQGATAWSSTAVGTMTGSGAGSLGGQLGKKKGRFRSLSRRTGRMMGGPLGAAMAVAAITIFWDDIKDAFDDVSGNILQDLLLPLSPRGSTKDYFPDLPPDSDMRWQYPRAPDNGYTGQPGRPPRRRGRGARTSSVGRGRGGDIVVQSTLMLDSRVAAKAVSRRVRREAAAR